MGGGLILNSPFDASWSAVTAGDFNGDGRADLVWQRASDGLAEVQFLNGTNGVGGGVLGNNPFGPDWSVVAAGDFNGDGKSDLVWHRASDGLTEIQFLNGNNGVGGGLILNSPFDKNWNVVAAGDFNGDGKSDLVWQRQSDGLVEIQLLNGNVGVGGGVIDNNPFGAEWQVAGAGDVNGDGKADLFWQRSSDGLVETQFLSGTTSLGGGVSGSNPFAPQFRVAATGDFNGDGTADILYRDVTFSGSAQVRLLDGLTGVGGGTLNSP
jgi:peptidyl-Asp metalloendopeptidase